MYINEDMMKRSLTGGFTESNGFRWELKNRANGYVDFGGVMYKKCGVDEVPLDKCRRITGKTESQSSIARQVHGYW